MKKIILVPFLVIIFSTAHLYAYVNKRYTWWNMRVKRLEELLVKVKNSRFADNSVKSLIRNDIETGRDFIAFHNRKIYRNLEKVIDPGSMTQSSIKKELMKRIYPVVAFRELEELLKSAGSPEIVKNVRKSVRDEIEKIIKEQAGISDKDLADFIGNYLVQKSELKILSLEMVLFMYLHNVEMRIDKIAETLAGTAMFKIKNRREGQDLSGFYMRTTEWAIDTCSTTEGREYRSEIKDALKGSQRWQIINKRFRELIGKKSEGLTALSAYRKRPADLVKQMNKINREQQQVSLSVSPLMLKEYRNYLEKIAGLLEKTASAGVHAYPYLEGRMRGTYGRILDIYRYLTSLPGMKKEKTKEVPVELLGRYRIEVKSYSEDLKKIKKRIDKNYRLISGMIRAYRKKVKQRGKSIRKYTAQHELNLIITLIEDYSIAFGKYNYETDLLNAYSAEFNRVIKQLKSKEHKPDPARFNKSFSLLKNIRFNSERLQKEKLNKEIIQKEGLQLVSSLSYLVNYYKRKGADINYYPASGYILQLKNRFKRAGGIKIGSWTMTSENYSVIDRNVSALFRRIISRNAWLETKSEKNNGETGSLCPVMTGGMQFTLNIPRGWFEEKLTESDRSRGIVKKFMSMDKRSSINLARVHFENRQSMDIKKTGEKWARVKGMKPVMKKWGKKENLDYYWILSRDRSGAVKEIYTLKRDNDTFILSGQTDSARYRFFRARLESVFNSIVF